MSVCMYTLITVCPKFCESIVLVQQCHRLISISYTVKPPKRGHFGTVAFVLSSEVVLLSEVAPFLLLNPIQCVRNVF